MALSQSSQFIIFKCDDLETLKDFAEFRAKHPDIVETISVPASQIMAHIGDCAEQGKTANKSAKATHRHRKSRWVYSA